MAPVVKRPDVACHALEIRFTVLLMVQGAGAIPVDSNGLNALIRNNAELNWLFSWKVSECVTMFDSKTLCFVETKRSNMVRPRFPACPIILRKFRKRWRRTG